uniref:Transient receptor potential cation channel subfamily V member 2 n=1 Tax=Varanus komodoensis TaxID=61221 RepID=A0A8D2LET1_VARKO
LCSSVKTYDGTTDDTQAAGDDGEKQPLETHFQEERRPSPTIKLDLVALGLADPNDPNRFNRNRLFGAIMKGNPEELEGLEDYLRRTHKFLTDTEYTDGITGKTCLMKAVLNPKDGLNPTIPLLLEIDKRTGNSPALIRAECKGYYKGHTALHIAIEKRDCNLVKLLVENDADVHAKACGLFFQQQNKGACFYFGELPLSLAACTNQPDILRYLLDNPHQKARLDERDSLGNTVFHALVMVANDTEKNTELVIRMYDELLREGARINPTLKMEEITNKEGLTPIKLAAKIGKVEILQHILRREIKDPSLRHLSRKFTEWTYGPVHVSLYDLSAIDSYEENSVLEILAYSSDTPVSHQKEHQYFFHCGPCAKEPLYHSLKMPRPLGLGQLRGRSHDTWNRCVSFFPFSLLPFPAHAQNRYNMVVLEPMNKLLEQKWNGFAAKRFCASFFCYLAFMAIFTIVAYYRPLDGKPPFPISFTAGDILILIGQIVVLTGGVYLMIVTLFLSLSCSYRLVQSLVLPLSAIMYLAGSEEYVSLMVLSLLLGWVDLLYYTRGFRQTGIYIVMIQKVGAILRNLLCFLIVYAIFLFGFTIALIILTGEASLPAQNESLQLNSSSSGSGGSNSKDQPIYSGLFRTSLALFRFTIGMGDLEFHENMQRKYFVMVLLLLFVILTYILLLNMLIALMTETVNNVSGSSQRIWKLQRAIAILEIEKNWFRCWKHSPRSGCLLSVGSEGKKDERWFLR